MIQYCHNGFLMLCSQSFKLYSYRILLLFINLLYADPG